MEMMRPGVETLRARLSFAGVRLKNGGNDRTAAVPSGTRRAEPGLGTENSCIADG